MFYLRFHLIAWLLLPTSCLAIGDSGGNGGCPAFTFLYATLPKGSAADVAAAIQKDLTPPAPTQSWLSKLFHREKNTEVHNQINPESIRKIVSDGPCPEADKPLDYAVRAGNVEATRYLLDNGADPSAFDGRNTLYTRCESFIYAGTANEAPENAPRRLKAYELTIERGGDVNRSNYWGNNALHECHSVNFLRFLIRNGAKPEQSHIDRAFQDAFMYEPNSYTSRRMNAYARIELFLQLGLRPSEKILIRLSDPHCGHASFPTFQSICPELHRLLSANNDK